MQQNNGLPIGRTRFGIGDVQHAGVDVLQRAERGVGPRPDPGERRLGGLRGGRQQYAELRGGGQSGGADQMAATKVDPFQIAVHGQSLLVRMLLVDQPNVNAKASTFGARNSISNWRSAMGPGCRIS